MARRININGKKKLNFSLLCACMIGGVIGAVIGEIFYNRLKMDWNPILLIGIYFAQFTFFVTLSGFISEWLTYHMRGAAWDGKEILTALGAIIVGVVVMFILGMLFQFLYGLGRTKNVIKDIDDYIILVDNSGSTSETDPKNERFSAIIDFVKQLDENKKVMLDVFDDGSQNIIPLSSVEKGIIQKIEEKLADFRSGGGTNIEAALQDAYSQYEKSDRKGAVILLSDGASSGDYKDIISKCNADNINIYTIGFSNIGFLGKRVLNKLSTRTDGCYYQIKELNNLTFTIKQMTKYANQRVLLDYRSGTEHGKVLFMILRVLFLLLLTLVLGIIVGFVIDSQQVVLGLLPMRLGIGLAAGFVLEAGLYMFYSETVIRFFVSVIMSVILAHYNEAAYKTDDYQEWGNIDSDFGQNTIDFGKDFGKEANDDFGSGKTFL